MTRVVLILASPTRWDEEGRLSGDHPLPLTETGRAALREQIELLPEIQIVYGCKANEACAEASALVAARFQVRQVDLPALEEIRLGLWQGLRRDELHHRYPSVLPMWEQDPLSVEPPEGESLAEACARLWAGVRKVLRKNSGQTVAVCLRPYAMQIVCGLLRGLDDQTIARSMKSPPQVATIDVADDFYRGRAA